MGLPVDSNALAGTRNIVIKAMETTTGREGNPVLGGVALASGRQVIVAGVVLI